MALNPSHGRTRIQMEFPTGGRVVIDIEGDKDYFEIASRRLPAMTKPLMLLSEGDSDLFTPNSDPTLLQSQPQAQHYLPPTTPLALPPSPGSSCSPSPSPSLYENPNFNPYPAPIQPSQATVLQSDQPTQFSPSSNPHHPPVGDSLLQHSDPSTPGHIPTPTKFNLKNPTQLIQQGIQFSKSKEAKLFMGVAVNSFLIAALLINPASRKLFSWIPLIGQPIDSFGNSLFQGYSKLLTPQPQASPNPVAQPKPQAPPATQPSTPPKK